MRSFLCVLLVAALCLVNAVSVSASHFRFGSISWKANTNNNDVEFTVTLGIRRSYGGFNSPPNIGESPYTDVGMYLGDGNAFYLQPTVVSVDAQNDWFLATQVFTHTYANTASRSAYFNTCCRLSSLQDGNGDNYFQVETIVFPNSGIQSPQSSLPAVVTVQKAPVVTFIIPVAVQAGQRAVFSLTPQASSFLPTDHPSGLSVDANTGVVTWLVPQNENLGFYALAVRMTLFDALGNELTFVGIDFMIKLVAPSVYHPPTFQAPTPAPGDVLTVNVGQTLTVNILASDIDNSAVTINNAGVPSGAVFTTTPGTQATAQIVFTPTSAQAGSSFVISLTATEPHGLTALTSFTIVVATHAPVFEVPTPKDGTMFPCIHPGQSKTISIAADNVDQTSTSITAGGLGLPSGAVLTTADGVAATASLTFSPVRSQAGQSYVVTLVATSPQNQQATTTLTLSVCEAGANGDPQFSGFLGQDFQVHGVSGNVYNVLSTPAMQFNALFQYLEQGQCRQGTPCFAHAGNYFAEVGLLFAAEDGKHVVRVVSGAVDVGLTVSHQGVPVPVGSIVSLSTAAGAVKIEVVSAFEVTVTSPQFDLRVQNSDHFLNQDVAIAEPLMKQIAEYKSAAAVGAQPDIASMPHGILGQTWQAKTYANRWKHIEGELFDYVVADGVEGSMFKFNRFAL